MHDDSTAGTAATYGFAGLGRTSTSGWGIDAHDTLTYGRAIRSSEEALNTPRTVLAVVLAFLVSTPVAVDGQPAGKVWRIGWLRYLPCPERSEFFRHGLHDRGYVEGVNLQLECRSAPGRVERLPELAAELVRLKVDILVTEGTPTTLAAKQVTNMIPIVMVLAGSPVENGLVTSLARPGGNITGLSIMAPELVVKALELLKEAAPAASRVALLTDRTNPAQTILDEPIDAAARALGLTLQRVALRRPEEFAGAFAAVLRQRGQALLVLPLPVSASDYQRIAEFARNNRLATISVVTSYPQAGLLMSLAPSFADQYRRAGIYVDRILRGAKPLDLPVEQLATFELIINMKTAKALDLTITPSLRLWAHEVIE